MVDSSQAATALLTEHLQYTPLSLIDDIINAVNNFVYQGVGSLETGLLSIPPERLGFQPVPPSEGNDDGGLEYPEAKHEIEEGLHKLETLLNSTVDKNFDKFEIYVLRNVLSVPADLVSWVRLPHYEGISDPRPENAPTAESVLLLRRKLAASKLVSKDLREEYHRNQVLLQQLRRLVEGGSPDAPGTLSFLTAGRPHARPLNGSLNPAEQPLTTNTTFALSQIPALTALLAELGPKLAVLKHATVGVGKSARDERREERRAYIEQRTSSHLERNGETVAAQTAAVIPGKVVDDREEIRALEKVAGMFAGP